MIGYIQKYSTLLIKYDGENQQDKINGKAVSKQFLVQLYGNFGLLS